MRAESLSLSAALNSSEVDYYTIPQYQRPYTWTSEEFEVLWADLISAYDDYKSAVKAEKRPDQYFMGPMVFVENKGRRSFDIIDGQQRTTTFHILLWYLSKRLTGTEEEIRLRNILTYLGAGKEPKLRVSAKDSATFLSVRTPHAEVSGDSKMAVAARYFQKEIGNLSDPATFSAFVRDYLIFIVIIAEDYGKAWDLFIGLNGKGVPLNPTDLVKAFVCGKSDIGDDAGLIWEETMLPLKNESTACLLFITRFKSGKFVTENKLFSEVAKSFPDKLSILDISDNARLFKLFWLTSINDLAKELGEGYVLSSNSSKSLRVLREIGRRDFTTLLMKYADAFGLKSIFEENFLKALASYQLRMAMTRKRSRERNFVSEFKDIQFRSEVVEGVGKTPGEIIVNDKSKALERIKTYLRSDAPTDKDFEVLVKMSSYGSTTNRILLRHYEEGVRGDKSITGFELEHLMPQTGTVFWYPCAAVTDEHGHVDQNAYNSLINNIGNLFVVDKLTNNEIKNFPFDIKRKSYQENLVGWSIATITATKDEWNRTDIETRAAAIADWAVKFWKI